MNPLKFFSFIPFLLLALPCASFGDEDFLIDMYYDPSKTYSPPAFVVLESNKEEIYTAKTLVPVNTPPPNAQYWSPSGEYTTALTSENSDELGTIPSDNFDKSTPGNPPTDEVPSFSSSTLELGYSENSTGSITMISANSAVSYSLSEELDYELFDLDDTTFELTFKNSPNYESPQDSNEDNIYQVVVVATNSNGSDSQTLKITIQNVLETPVFVPSNTDVVEFSSETGEYSVNVSDTNTADITLGGTDSAKFFFNSATGIISFDPNFEPEADASYSLIIEASNAEGSSFLTLTVNTSFDEESVVVPSGLLSATSEQFVMQQYRDFFARDADKGGLAWWADQIDSGNKERANLAMDFVYSAEYQNNVAPVVRLYFAYFNRLPDTGGLSYWISEYTSGNRTLTGISDAFAASAEFSATYGSLSNGGFVDLIYNNLFGRTADSGGKTYWTGELDSGAKSRGNAMVGFSESAEYKNLLNNQVSIVSYYYGMLRRAPDLIMATLL
jgi:hypothetical protein